MKKIILLTIALLLFGCIEIAATERKITVIPETTYWKITVTGSAEIWAIPQEEISQMSNTAISINLTSALIALESPNCKQNTVALGYDNITLSFGTLSKGEYAFDNSKCILISNGKKYILKPLDGKKIGTILNVTPQKNKQGNYYWPNRYHKFKLPLLCDSLDKTIVEISGIYKNSKELPPIKFKINLINPTK